MKAKLANRRHICQVTIALPWRSEWVSSGQKLIRLFVRLYHSHEGIAPVSQGGRGTTSPNGSRPVAVRSLQNGWGKGVDTHHQSTC